MRFLFYLFVFIVISSQTHGLSILKKEKVKEVVKDTKSNAINKIDTHTHGFVAHQVKFTSFEKCKPCEKEARCVPPIQCPAHLRMTKTPQLCDLPGKAKSHGLCCTSRQNHTTKDFKKAHLKARASESSALKDIFHEATHEFDSIMHEQVHVNEVEKPTEHFKNPDFFHQMVFGNHNPQEAVDVAGLVNSGVKQIMASKVFKDKQQLSTEDSQLNHFDLNFSGTPFDKTCPKRPHCNLHARYRTYDGTCNHKEGKETWGAAKTPMERLVPPAYEDGIWAPRITSHDGTKLKSARTISRLLFPDFDRPHPYLNLMVMQFGQFISHDITMSSSITLPNGGRVKCCSDDGSFIQKTHFACMPIFIDEHDKFYREFNQRCMNFVRLAIAPDHNCRMGYAKQLSKVTHYIDGSAIYGSDVKSMLDLRSFKHGQLKMFIDFNRELLPLNPKPADCIVDGFACFLAGDVRVNQHITLVAIHLLFAREHNRIAEALHQINPQWDDDLLFEESRRIVVAEIQHITYNEWLPLIIGHEAMSRFSLFSRSNEYNFDYDEEINPSMTNEFTGAAFRFGHSTVQGKLFVEFEHRLEEVIALADTFNNPARFRFKHFYDEILRTLVHEPMQSADNAVTVGLSRFLFRAGSPFGLDLISLNIQRGRDEGLRPYNDYLALIGSKVVENFHEFTPPISEKLEKVYNSPHDIDLFVGGLLESAEDDAVVGATFREIIADQFSRLKRGDRYFYENSPDINPGHLSLHQLNEIKKTTLARIICDNADGVALTTQSPRAFIQSNLDGNEPIDCSSAEIQKMNLSPWKA